MVFNNMQGNYKVFCKTPLTSEEKNATLKAYELSKINRLYKCKAPVS